MYELLTVYAKTLLDMTLYCYWWLDHSLRVSWFWGEWKWLLTITIPNCGMLVCLAETALPCTYQLASEVWCLSQNQLDLAAISNRDGSLSSLRTTFTWKRTDSLPWQQETCSWRKSTNTCQERLHRLTPIQHTTILLAGSHAARQIYLNSSGGN